jgi:hypothetical protein
VWSRDGCWDNVRRLRLLVSPMSASLEQVEQIRQRWPSARVPRAWRQWASDDIAYLLAEVSRLTQERDALREDMKWVCAELEKFAKSLRTSESNRSGLNRSAPARDTRNSISETILEMLIPMIRARAALGATPTEEGTNDGT